MKRRLKNITVVYIEDEEPVRCNIATALKRRVGRVETAANGKEGLEKIEQLNPDIVITDLEMPVMGGIAMIQKVRERYDHNRPIIVITAYRDEEHYTDLADAYLFKPVLFDELEKLILELITKYGLGGRESD